jgi:integrase
MAFIKKRKTNKGLTFHLVEVVNGREKAVKLPVNNVKGATAYLYKYLGDKADNRPNSLMVDQVKLRDFLPKYLELSKANKNALTFSRDLSNLKPLLKEWEAVNLSKITHLSIQEAQTKWINEGLAKKTVNNRSICLSAILRMAYKQGLLASMPEIPKFKIDKKPPHWFSDDQIKKILDNANPFVRDFVIVLLNTGMRLGELQRLKWSDIDLKSNKIMIEISKSHRFRVIPINDTLSKHLLQLYKDKTKGQVYLFEGCEKGTQFSNYYHAFKRELVKLGIAGHVHTLRHTFASRLVQRGVNIYNVSKLLGHASVQTTQIYAHLRNDDLQKAVNVLG